MEISIFQKLMEYILNQRYDYQNSKEYQLDIARIFRLVCFYIYNEEKIQFK